MCVDPFRDAERESGLRGLFSLFGSFNARRRHGPNRPEKVECLRLFMRNNHCPYRRAPWLLI